MNLTQYIIIHADTALSLFAISTLISYISMVFYLKKHSKVEGIIGNWGLLWPKIIIEYRNFTKIKNGTIGIFFYIFIISISITIVVFIAQFVCSIIEGPIYLDHTGKILNKPFEN